MKEIKPPTSFKKRYNKIIESKALNLKYFLFYYYKILKNYCLDDGYIVIQLLSEIFKKLYSKFIYKKDFYLISRNIYLFKRKYFDLVGIDGCSHNFHLMDHLLEDLVNFGPLWCHSCFPFENLFGKINNFIYGSTFQLENLNLLFHFRKISNKLYKIINSQNINYLKLIKKQKEKNISFFKEIDNEKKLIKYFKFNDCKIYSKISNKSNLFLSYFIKVINDEIYEIIKIWLENNIINLLISNEKTTKIIKLSEIECQCVKIDHEYSVILEPITLF